jgi:hypothetical protein
MTRDDIIRMAQEAGIYYRDEYEFCEIDRDGVPMEMMAKFATLVAAAEREKVAQWMISKGYSTGHGDTTEDLLRELEWQMTEGRL